MKTYIIIALSILILLLIVVYSKVKISIKIMKDGKNDKVVFKVIGLFGAIRYKKEYPILQISTNKEGFTLKVAEEVTSEHEVKEKEQTRLNYKEVLELIYEYKKAFGYMIQKTKIKKIMSNLYFSNENVFISIGLYSFVNAIYKLLYDSLETDNMSLKIVPGFNENSLKLNFNTLFYLRLNDFIYLYKHYKLFKPRKGGV